MKILLLQHAPYLGAFGGAPKANRSLLEALAERGHTCRAVAPASKGAALPEPVVSEAHQGVEVRIVAQPTEVRGEAARQIEELAPDRILVASEDPGQLLLRRALRASRGSSCQVFYLTQTTVNLPFGPASLLPSPEGTELLRQTAGVVVISRYLQDYCRQWAGIESEVYRFPAYGPGPFPALENFDRGAVTLINACAIKGLPIFLALAGDFPEIEFAAVPTWGTTGEDRAALARLANVRILPPTPDIDALFAQVRILVAPSLWQEGFGLVAVEAMLRGVPVLASDAGGLPEAKLGVDYILPVRQIEQYNTSRLNDINMPMPIVPPQDLSPWREALAGLLADRARYEALSRQSRQTALEFVSSLSAAPFEELLSRPRV
jgi:hypothetical protein